MTINSDSIKNAKVKKAINNLIFKQSFFSSIILQQKIVEDNTMPTFSVDGTTLRYNDEFANSLKHEEICAVIIHEVLHLVLLHHCRMGNRDHKLFNMAADYAINPQIVNAFDSVKFPYKLPKGCLIDSRFNNMNAEDIYRILEKEKKDKKDKPGNQGQPKPGDSKGKPGGETKDDSNSPGQPSGNNGDKPSNEEPTSFGEFTQAKDIQVAEETIKIQTKQAANLSKACGQTPLGGILDIIEEAQKPRYDWRETLARFVSEICAKDYTFNRANPRHLSRGIILPTLYSRTFGKVIVLVDSSGSMFREIAALLNEITSCFEMMSEDNQKCELTVIYCDAQVNGIQTFTAGDDIKLEVRGGGGTALAPGFDYIRDKLNDECECCFILTDGYVSDIHKINQANPPYACFWGMTCANNNFNPIFGEKFQIISI